MKSGSQRPASRWHGRIAALPRPWRRVVGGGLVLGGVFGFLPVVGFWMLPLGLLVLSQDSPRLRRWRRRMAIWWHRR
ncbi:MAG: hypothetical protein RIM84_22435 [Alphaproteobacteria bacterium]